MQYKTALQWIWSFHIFIYIMFQVFRFLKRLRPICKIQYKPMIKNLMKLQKSAKYVLSYPKKTKAGSTSRHIIVKKKRPLTKKKIKAINQEKKNPVHR